MRELTPRERVLLCIERKEPDRVPISFDGATATGIVESIPNGRTYTKLCKYLEINDYDKPQVGEIFNIVSNVDDRIRQKLGSDIRVMWPNMPSARIESDGTKTWEAFCGMRIKRVGLYDESFEFPFRNWTSKKDIENHLFWPDPDKIDIAKGKREEAKHLRETTDYAISTETMYSFLPFNGYGYLSGMDKWFIDMKIRPKFYFELADKLLEIGSAINTKYLKAVGDYIDIIGIFDDLGTQEGPLINYDDYVKFYKPYTKKMIATIKKYTDAKILMHTCGSVYEFIPDLIEIGVDILNPLQPLAKNMEPWRLKKEFGNKICFCGGIDTQELLPHGSVEEVKKEVRKTIEIYAPGGGYILGPSQNFQPDVPPKNIVAMYQAAQEYGKYPIL